VTSAYAPLPETLSQGDIVTNAPWGLIEAPLSICRPQNATETAGKAKYGPPSGHSHPPAFSQQRPENIHLKGHLGLAMVLWHDCQIDKFKEQGKPVEKWLTAIAPIVPMTANSDPALVASVREGRRRAFFHLPEFTDQRLPESYVDLRYILSVKQTLLTERITTLSTESREDLYRTLFQFLTARRIVAESVCPHCSSPIDLSVFMTRADDDEAATAAPPAA